MNYSYFKNKPVILTLDIAALYLGYIHEDDFLNEINLYVESRIKNLELEKHRIIQKQIISFSEIDYDIDEEGIKCVSKFQLLRDLIKRSYKKEIHNKKEFNLVCYELVKDFMIKLNDFEGKTLETFIFNKKYLRTLRRYLKIVNKRFNSYIIE